MLVLIDEVDDLIALDEQANDQLFEAFHNLNNDFRERCRFVFAGYRELARQCMDYQSRFRNFAEPIRLGNLDLLNARLLIREPLCDELGFRFDDEAIIDEIILMTGGHPNYIQVFCKGLSEYLEQQRRRRIRREDIDYVFQSGDFRSRIIETFYVNFSLLQQLIVTLLIYHNQLEFGIPDVLNVLFEQNIPVGNSDVYRELRQLEMSFVLRQSGQKYQFVHKLFPEMLKKSVDLEDLALMLLQEFESKLI